MTYQETIGYLQQMLPMYQRVGKQAYKKDLNNTLRLLDALDNPQHHFKSVHIAGTNGKGTSAHCIAAIMQSAGYKTGLYTSPHLKNFTERIKINGVEVEESYVIEFVQRLKPFIEEIKPSFFEITVVMAFAYFSERKVDIAIIETGLGGRLDSTNVLEPEVSLITNIGMDHMDLLGDTLEKIAGEKAGIIKPGVPVVIGEHQEEIHHVFENKAAEVGASLSVAQPKLIIDSTDEPYYKRRNANGILATVEVLRSNGWKLNDKQIIHGFSNMESLTGFKGRFQLIRNNPQVIADVSHNLEGLTLLFNDIRNRHKGHVHIVFGTVRDKPVSEILQALPKDASLYWTQSSVPRSLDVDVLAKEAEAIGLHGHKFLNVNEAYNHLLSIAKADELILITGSTFLVADLDIL